MDQHSPPRIRIIHETDPVKYFPALHLLAEQGRITIVGQHRYSVFKEFLRAGLKDRKPLLQNARASFRDLRLRIILPAIKGEIIVLGFAPWDWRIAIYGVLSRRNKILYHTSWPYWQERQVPKQYGPLNKLFRLLWLRLLRHPNVHAVAVLDASRVELRSRFDISTQVIPHAVPDAFYDAQRLARTEQRATVRLIYVGGLWPKKGIDQLLRLMQAVSDEPIDLTIVGDGTMRDQCESAASTNPAIRYLGPISSRSTLAATMASHDILMLLSQRDPHWQELFSLVVAEAMAAGLGVIATNHIGPASLLEGATLGNLFRDDDIDGPLQLLRRLAANNSELNQFRADHSLHANDFRLSGVAERWMDVIESVR